jgi:sodium/proline symporter
LLFHAGRPPLLIAVIIITLYTVIGGLYAVSWTTLVQGGVLILGVFFMAPLVLLKAGGLTHINEALADIDPNLVQPWFPSPVYANYAFCTPEFLVSFGLRLTIGLAVAPHVINNVLAAKEDRYFRWSPLIAFVLYAVVMFLVKFAGFAVRVLVEEGQVTLPAVKNAQDYAFVYGVQHVNPNIFAWHLCGDCPCGGNVNDRPSPADHWHHVLLGYLPKPPQTPCNRQGSSYGE